MYIKMDELHFNETTSGKIRIKWYKEKKKKIKFTLNSIPSSPRIPIPSFICARRKADTFSSGNGNLKYRCSIISYFLHRVEKFELSFIIYIL